MVGTQYGVQQSIPETPEHWRKEDIIPTTSQCLSIAQVIMQSPSPWVMACRLKALPWSERELVVSV